MKKILLDTNFLMLCAQFKVDIFSEIEKICDFKYELNILDKTLDELKNIVRKQKGKNKEAAKVALQLLKIKRIKIIKTDSSGKTDDIIADYAKKDDFIVATQDKDLKRRLINHRKSVIIMRQRKMLVFVNDKGFS